MELPPKIKVPVAFAALLALGVFAVADATSKIGELAPTARSNAWLAFALVWALVAFGFGIAIYPQWRSGHVIARNESERQQGAHRIHRLARTGAPIGSILASLTAVGWIGASLWIGLLAVFAGLLTVLLGLAVALRTTQRGRAMQTHQQER